MGKKSSWISILKKAFTPKSKEKVHTGEKNHVKQKQQRQELEKKRHGEKNSIIPLYREPSSIEKILGDVEKEQQHKAHETSPIRRQHTSANTTKNAVSDKMDSISSDRKLYTDPYNTKSTITSKQAITRNGKPVTSNFAQISATKIQAAYRGYMARRSYKILKGLLRLRNMMNGQNVKRQTMNTMRSMQLLVRIQTQIHARRLQMMENQNAHQHLMSRRSSNENSSSLSKWNANQLDREAHDEWDDSVLTKEEIEASVKRKEEAVTKRERALAYAYSHQLPTITPKTAQSAPTNARSGGYSLWWNWLEHRIPSDSCHAKTPSPENPRTSSATTAAAFAINRPSSRSKAVQTPLANTPRISRPIHTGNSSKRWQTMHARPALRDDDSLTSCPVFNASKPVSGNLAAQIPNYMAPTISAKAKARAAASDGGGGGKEGKRGFSFALGQSIGSLRLFSSTKASTPAIAPATPAVGRHRSTLSVGEHSVDSTVSLPANLLRRPFK